MAARYSETIKPNPINNEARWLGSTLDTLLAPGGPTVICFRSKDDDDDDDGDESQYITLCAHGYLTCLSAKAASLASLASLAALAALALISSP